jgi:hypothetical protein
VIPRYLFAEIGGAALLIAAGVFGLWAWWRLRRTRMDSTYWLIASLGMLFLAADERFSLHEKIGRFLADAGVHTPGTVNHLDDVVVISYALGGLALTLYFIRDLLSQHRTVLLPYLLAMGLTAASIAVDAAAPVEGYAPVFEEGLELSAAASFALAFYRRWSMARTYVDAPAPVAGAQAAAPASSPVHS